MATQQNYPKFGDTRVNPKTGQTEYFSMLPNLSGDTSTSLVQYSGWTTNKPKDKTLLTSDTSAQPLSKLPGYTPQTGSLASAIAPLPGKVDTTSPYIQDPKNPNASIPNPNYKAPSSLPPTIPKETPKEISASFVTGEISAAQTKVEDLQKQQEALKKYGLTDTSKLAKDASGNYVPAETGDGYDAGEDALTKEYKDLFGTAVDLDQKTRDLEITKIQADTNYALDTIKEAYDKGEKDINRAYNLIAGLFAIPKEKLQDIMDADYDLTKTYISNVAKINADENYAIQKADLTMLQDIQDTKGKYLDFVATTIKARLDYAEKTQNYARERISTLAFTGAIANLDDAALIKLAKDSGYSIADLTAMRSAVSTNADKFASFINKTDENGTVSVIGIKKTGETEIIGTYPGMASPTGKYAPIVSGGLSISKGDIADGQQKLKKSRGETDKFADTTMYLDMMEHWTNQGGLLEDFLSHYPPKNYLNPSDSIIPAWLQNYMKAGQLVVTVPQ